jgi:K+/H+ antiporter YhaU regulatory subunit KhtT
MRNRELLANPKSMTVFEIGDRVGFIGDKVQIDKVDKLLSETDISDVGVEWET